MQTITHDSIERLRAAAFKSNLPAVLIDLPTFDHNVQELAKSVAGTGLSLRIATKSLRVPDLILRARKSQPQVFKGLMCYSAEEAKLFSDLGEDDLFVAYPKLQNKDLEILAGLHRSGKNVSMVVDSIEGCEKLSAVLRAAGNTKPFPIVFELDVSEELLGGKLWLGVRRSPLRAPQEMTDLIKACVQTFPELSYRGLMAYEAQVSATTDANPAEKIMRHWQKQRVARKRQKVFEVLKTNGLLPKFFNGGGTGCLHWARDEKDILTEIAVGSGFYFSHLFDGSTPLDLRPSIFFALPRCRVPAGDNWATYQGGGFIASGATGSNRAPKIIWPEHTATSVLEGFGEVQTPVQFLGEEASEFVIARPSKAGEIAERFNEFWLVDASGELKMVKTYRGLGHAFH